MLQQRRGAVPGGDMAALPREPPWPGFGIRGKAQKLTGAGDSYSGCDKIPVCFDEEEFMFLK